MHADCNKSVMLSDKYTAIQHYRNLQQDSTLFYACLMSDTWRTVFY